MALFSKKICSVCGGEIKLLGNRKLEDGNLCKSCASKLSPWFSDRRSSTVDEIKAQLAYREANREAVAAFHTTRSLGGNTKVLIDEDAGKFVVTSARDLLEANPDVLDFSQVTGCDLDVQEHRSEARFRDKENRMVSYVPARYTCSYDFEIDIRVNHPYFDSISFQLNPSSVETTAAPVVASRIPDPQANAEYREYQQMGTEIKNALSRGRRAARSEAQAAAAPKVAKICPACGASTIPDANGCCEYCGCAMG